MKTKLLLLLGLPALMGSCEKTSYITLVEPDKPGRLSYQIVDDSGKGMVGLKVSLYDTSIRPIGLEVNPDNPIDTRRTNPDGVADFNDLLPGNYKVVSDSAAINGILYRTYEYIQVISNLEKKKTVKASDFSGILKVKLLSSQDRKTVLSNMGIVAYRYGRGPDAKNVKNFVASAVLKAVTDENGMASIKVPFDAQYNIIVYSLTSGDGVDQFGSHTISKGEETKVTIYY